MNTDFDFSATDGWLLILAVPAGILVALRLYRHANISGPIGTLLLGVRSAAFVLAAVLLIEPILAVTVNTTRRPLVALLVDDSESMQIVESGDPRSDVAGRILDGPGLADLGDRARLRYFAFSETAREFDPSEARPGFDGGATNIALALERVREATAGDGLAAVILLSDGAHNLGGQPERAAENAGVPIHALGVGRTEAPVDLAVTASREIGIGYVGQALDISAAVQTHGLSQGRAVVTVTQGDRQVGAAEVTLSDGEREVSIPVVPDRAGEQVFRISVPEQAGERTVDNNQVLVSVTVLERRVGVLLAGAPSPDFAFLRRTLEEDPNFAVETVYPSRSGSWPFSLRDRVGDPAGFDLVVLADMPAAVLAGGRGKALARWVSEGGALLVIGGRQSLDAAYARSPLAEVLPFSPGSGGYTEEPFILDVDPSAIRHPIVRVSEDPPADLARWASLPPLLGYRNVGPARKGAEVLAWHPAPIGGGGRMPMVAVGRAGTGKTMGVAARGFWRHSLMMRGLGDTGLLAETFWRNAVRWLVARDQVERLRISSEKTGYRSGEPITLQARLLDELLEPVDGARVTVALESDPPRRFLMQGRGRGIYSGKAGGLPQGQYRFSAVAERGGRELAQSTGDLTVGRYSLEFEDLRLRTDVLQRIAERSGGRYAHADSVDSVLGQMSFSPQPYRRSYQSRLWGRDWPFFVILCLLAGEWAVRRRRGMV